jgi:signal transduction histidine kinase
MELIMSYGGKTLKRMAVLWSCFIKVLMDSRTEYKEFRSIVNLVLFYRFSSLIITSALYYFSASHKETVQKLVVLLGMLLACAILSWLYIDNRNNRKYILILTMVEALGNSIFILVSGGFASPYIWYFISTLYIAAVELPFRIAAVQAIIYFTSASIPFIWILSQEMNRDITRLYWNIAISFILVVLGLLQIIKYAAINEDKTKSLSVINEELKEAKIKVEKTLKYCIEIYETVNIFNLDNSIHVLEELLNHIIHLTGIKQGIFLRLSTAGNRDIYVSHGIAEKDEILILNQAKQLLSTDTERLTPKYGDFEGRRISVHLITHGGIPYGAFIAVTDELWFLKEFTFGENEKDINGKTKAFEQFNVIPIFMEMAGVVLKKLELDDLGEKLLISEEQNRIANEIHDIALQKLFAISCNLYVLSTKSQKISEDTLKSELLSIKHSVDITMKELREAVYGFSWEKDGEDTFKNKLLKYTEEVRKLQAVEAYTEIIGDTQRIRTNQKSGLYRIICEAMNNAVRHGKAKHIRVCIMIEDNVTSVQIKDDGKGFDYEEYQKKDSKGIGLSNIYRIVKLLNGYIEIKSKISDGTEIYLSIPCI